MSLGVTLTIVWAGVGCDLAWVIVIDLRRAVVAVEFLTAEQAARYGSFHGVLLRAELERYFFDEREVLGPVHAEPAGRCWRRWPSTWSGSWRSLTPRA